MKLKKGFYKKRKPSFLMKDEYIEVYLLSEDHKSWYANKNMIKIDIYNHEFRFNGSTIIDSKCNDYIRMTKQETLLFLLGRKNDKYEC